MATVTLASHLKAQQCSAESQRSSQQTAAHADSDNQLARRNTKARPPGRQIRRAEGWGETARACAPYKSGSVRGKCWLCIGSCIQGWQRDRRTLPQHCGPTESRAEIPHLEAVFTLPPAPPPHSYASPTLSTSSRLGRKRGRRFLLLIWSWQMQRWPLIKHRERETMGRLMAEKRRPLSVQSPPPLSSRRTGCAQWGEAWETGCWAPHTPICVCVCGWRHLFL